MPSEEREVRFLLDEHYPAWLAQQLTEAGVDTNAVCADRSELRGEDDSTVLAAAVADRRVVVTEDVTTFGAAVALVAHHVGIVYCHHARFPRNARGLHALRQALVALAQDPPTGLGTDPIEWWLPPWPG